MGREEFISLTDQIAVETSLVVFIAANQQNRSSIRVKGEGRAQSNALLVCDAQLLHVGIL